MNRHKFSPVLATALQGPLSEGKMSGHLRFFGVCGSSPGAAHTGFVLLLGRFVNSKSIGVSVDLSARSRYVMMCRKLAYSLCRSGRKPFKKADSTDPRG